MRSVKITVHHVVALGLILLSLSVFCLYNYIFSVDFPYMDDFMLVLFVQEYSTNGFGFVEFINKLFQSANSHKMVVPRLVALTDYFITGTLNFKYYQLLVTINILLILGLFYYQFRRLNLKLLFFVPVVLLLLHPQYYDITLFGLNGIQHSSVILFTLMALFVIQTDTPYAFPIAIFLCFVSTFSHGNGLCAYFGLFYTLLAFKRYKQLAISILCMIISLGIFLYKTNDSSVAVYPENIRIFIKSLLGFLGSTLAQSSSYGISLAVIGGSILVLFLGFRSFRYVFSSNGQMSEKEKQEIFWLSFFVFILATSSIISLVRSWDNIITASRFHIYGSLNLIVGYIVALLVFKNLRQTRVAIVFILGSVFINAHSYYYYSDEVLKRKTQFIADIYNWQTYRKMFSVGMDFLSNSDYFFTPAYESGLILKQKPIVSEQEVLEYIISPDASAININTDLKIEINKEEGRFKSSYQIIISNSETPGPLVFTGLRFLALSSLNTNQTLLVSTSPIKATQLEFLSGAPYYKSGFNTILRENDLPSGTYAIAVLDYVNDEKTYYKVEKQFIEVLSDGTMEVVNDLLDGISQLGATQSLD